MSQRNESMKAELRNQSLTFVDERKFQKTSSSFIGERKDRSKSLKKSSSKRRQNAENDLINVSLSNVKLNSNLRKLKSNTGKISVHSKGSSRHSSAQRSNSRKNRYIRKTQSISSIKLMEENERLKTALGGLMVTFQKFKFQNS